MKKYFKLLTVTSVILFALTFVSCGLLNAFKDSVEESYNQWYKYEKNIKIPLGSTDDENVAEDHALQDAELYLYFNTDSGLKVAIQSKSSQDVQMLSGLVTQTVDVVIGGTKQYDINKFGKVQWTALWSSGKFEKSEEPKISSNPEECVVLAGEDKGEFKIQWKKVLVNLLSDKLLED